MADRNFINAFRKAAWTTDREVEEFIRRNADVTENNLRHLFGVIARDGARYNHRQLTAMEHVATTLAVTRRDVALCPTLIDMARTADERFRRVAGQVLVELNDASWHGRLFQFFTSRDDRARAFADRVLSQVGGKTVLAMIDETAAERWTSRMEVIHTLVQIAGHHAIPVLMKMLPVADRGERVRIVQLLGDEAYMKAARKEAAAALFSLIHDDDPMVRGRAAEGLGAMGSEEHVGPITEMVWDENPWVAKAAVGALGRLRTPLAIETLGEASRIDNVAIQTACVDALLAIGSDEAVPTLVTLLESENLVLRNKATEGLVALGRDGKVNLARMLVLMMNSPNVHVRRAVVEIINEVGDRDGTLWKRLVRHLRDEDWWVRERATEVLVNISGDQITEHVIELLEDPSDIVRRYAVEVLLRLKDLRAIAPLAKAAKDDADWWVQERAIEALGEIGDRRATPVVVNLLKNPALHWVCVEALGRLGDPRAIPYLGRLMLKSSGAFRLAVLKALDAIGSPEIVPEVTRVANDVDKEVRLLAQQILARHDVEVDTGIVEQRIAESLSFIDALLEEAKNRGATDLYIMPNAPPSMKLLGTIQPVYDRTLTPEETADIVDAILSDKKRREFRERKDVDTSYESQNEHYRFRVNVYTQHAGTSIVFRVISDEIYAFEDLNLPDKVLEFTRWDAGLVIIAGPSNSGKSTTLTTLIDHINRHDARHVITLEDPIEFRHANDYNCLINQREIGTHTLDYMTALRSVLREDPDVILVGEMRDKETISFAVTAAETGHLVFGTLHTISAANTVDRILDAFPPHQQPQIRVMISESLRGVLCQQLLMRADGKGRVLAVELMINNHAIANLIRQGKIHQIPSTITTSQELGMRLMDREMLAMATSGVITPEEAYAKATDRKLFAHFFEEDEEDEADAAGARPRPAGRV